MEFFIYILLNLVTSSFLVGLLNFYLKEKIKNNINKNVQESEHRLRRDLQKNENDFNIAASSHMSTVIFDKHVEFVELYYSNVLEVFSEIIESGNDYDKLSKLVGSRGLRSLRLKYAVWLTL
ncbi:hypothetical protein [Photobacterium leiognathi]|uniref:hypothetical protein n=1 Tax=Photobacterium leiognathi TaxID=553611 RepID=UPI002980BF1E|nr:hypothetical protein [Photobacterium leiognathi]